MKRKFKTMDANEAVAHVAYRLNEVIAIYPITPSSPDGRMGGSVGVGGRSQHLGHCTACGRDAERRRCCRSCPRRLADRSPGHHFYSITGPAADDPEYEQDCRRTDARNLPWTGAYPRYPCLVDFRRPQ